MRKIRMPTIRFPPWYPWADRSQHESKRLSEIYLLAITSKDLAGTRPQWKDVSYIGMTTSRGGLSSRWQQFANTIHG